MSKFYFFKLLFLGVSLFFLTTKISAQTEIPYFTGKKNKTATYQQMMNYWEEAAKQNENLKLQSFGSTDSGYPLHLISLNPSDEVRAQILINNNIHPGESDGIEATIQLIKNYLEGTLKLPKHTQINIIAAYNIGGMLNRNSTTRVNQNGPEEYGFRGNARNYDLNRDFMKADTKNSFAFYEIFHTIDPDIFVDNHVSNGADYQYTLTYLFSQHNKLSGPLAQFQEKEVIPKITKNLNQKGISSTPYVNVFNAPPNQGFAQFLDSPRYSSGFTSLWNNISFMIETHMLKNYKQRVEVTYETLVESIHFLEQHHESLKAKRKAQVEYWLKQNHYPIQWELDSTQVTTFNFEGFHHTYEKSEVTGLERLKYHTNQPKEFEVDYYNHYKAVKSIQIPSFYVIPKAWEAVIKRLSANQIEMQKLQSDTLIEVTQVKIETFETAKSPYEGHYLHYNTSTSEQTTKTQFYPGDVLVSTEQKGIRYIIESLEPEAVDSFFNWNFFDSILQRKEGFSPYVFEDIALEVLKNNPQLKQEFESLKAKDKNFSKNAYAQLNWIYEASGIQEKTYKSYPIFKIY